MMMRRRMRREGFRSRGLGCLYRWVLGDYIISEVKRSHGSVLFAVACPSVWEGAGTHLSFKGM